MNRTLVAISALLLASTVGAAAPTAASSKQAADAALAERVINAEAEARQRELETRLKVLETQDQKVQAEFAVMMEELDQKKPK